MMEMTIGEKYRFKYTCEEESEPIEYVGYNWSGNGYWHQFTKNGKVWCELQEDQFELLEIVENKK